MAIEYKYLSNTSEWFYNARKKAESVSQMGRPLKIGKQTVKKPMWNIYYFSTIVRQCDGNSKFLHIFLTNHSSAVKWRVLMRVSNWKINLLSKGDSTEGSKIPFISNPKRPAFASKRDELVLATKWYFRLVKICTVHVCQTARFEFSL